MGHRNDFFLVPFPQAFPHRTTVYRACWAHGSARHPHSLAGILQPGCQSQQGRRGRCRRKRDPPRVSGRLPLRCSSLPSAPQPGCRSPQSTLARCALAAQCQWCRRGIASRLSSVSICLPSDAGGTHEHLRCMIWRAGGMGWPWPSVPSTVGSSCIKQPGPNTDLAGHTACPGTAGSDPSTP